MAMYRITTWHEATITKVNETVRLTRTAAFKVYRRACYDVLQAFDKLDTIAAQVTMAACDKHNDILPVGESHSILVSNTGNRVTITREA